MTRPTKSTITIALFTLIEGYILLPLVTAPFMFIRMEFPAWVETLLELLIWAISLTLSYFISVALFRKWRARVGIKIVAAIGVALVSRLIALYVSLVAARIIVQQYYF